MVSGSVSNDVYVSAVISAIISATVAILVTKFIELLGGVKGGLLASIPSTIIPASLGIYAASNNDKNAFAATMNTIPPGMFLNVFFLYLWRVIPPRFPSIWTLRRRLTTMVSVSLLAWFSLALALVFILRALRVYPDAILIFALVSFTCMFAFGVVTAIIQTPPAPKGSNPTPLSVLLSRGLLAGTAVFISVVISPLSDLASGVASVFPAIFLTSMVGIWVSQGTAVQGGAIAPMMLGSLSVSMFSFLCTYFYDAIGPAAGAVVCFFISIFAVSWPSFFFLRYLQSRQAAKQLRDQKEKEESVVAHDEPAAVELTSAIAVEEEIAREADVEAVQEEKLKVESNVVVEEIISIVEAEVIIPEQSEEETEKEKEENSAISQEQKEENGQKAEVAKELETKISEQKEKEEEKEHEEPTKKEEEKAVSAWSEKEQPQPMEESEEKEVVMNKPNKKMTH